LAQVVVERENGCLGLTLRGGGSEMPIIITNVRTYGPAYKTSRIKPGDRVLRVDNVRSCLFKNSSLHVIFMIFFLRADFTHSQVVDGSAANSQDRPQQSILQSHNRVRGVGDAER
jgi:hypothetical protein